MSKLIREIRSCTFCERELPLEPRPILQFHRSSRMLLVGQAPGIKAHDSRKPWNDASGERLREWLNLSHDQFYDPKFLSIVPMGFCYPGRGQSGDLPPRKECSALWMDSILSHLKKLEHIIVVGSYSANYFLGPGDLTAKIHEHAQNDSPYIVLPHPSPRNNIWLKKNEWFEHESLKLIRLKLRQHLRVA